jgi:hypothetical protein
LSRQRCFKEGFCRLACNLSTWQNTGIAEIETAKGGQFRLAIGSGSQILRSKFRAQTYQDYLETSIPSEKFQTILRTNPLL